MPFGKLFINSLFDNVDFTFINEIFICDTGLSKDSKAYLCLYPRVKLIETGMNTHGAKMHDKDWEKNVYSKTSFLLNNVEQTKTPTIMLDSDSLFLSDFFDLIDPSVDLIACRRSRQGFSRHIGSFFVINNPEKSIGFLRTWIQEIKHGETAPNAPSSKESPALSRTIDTTSENIKISELSEELVSYFSYEGYAPHDNVRIMHLKSDFGRETIEKRIDQPYVAQYARKYL